MATLVSFLAGDPDAIRACLRSGGFPEKLPASKFFGEVGFKFGIPLEAAFDALISRAAQIRQLKPFQFEDCVTGDLAPDKESFQGFVDERFLAFFSEFPDEQVHLLSSMWTDDLGALYDAESPFLQPPKVSGMSRLRSGLETVIIGAVMLPIFAVCYLIPSFRRERAMNKKKRPTSEYPAPPTNDEQVASLIRLCRIAHRKNTPLLCTWHI